MQKLLKQQCESLFWIFVASFRVHVSKHINFNGTNLRSSQALPDVAEAVQFCFSWINPLDSNKKNNEQPKTHPVLPGFLVPKPAHVTIGHFGILGTRP